jgi:hypothetical protein
MGVVASAPAQALTFTNTFDASWTKPSLYAGAQQSVTEAENTLSDLFSNAVNINIQFTSTTATGLADSYFNNNNYAAPYGSANYTYTQIQTDLQNHSAAHPKNTALASLVANLPATIIFPGCYRGTPNFMLPDAESLALTGSSALGGPYTFQGFVDINPTFDYDYSQSGGIGAGQIDLVSVMLHEITHVMGRVDFSFAEASSNTPFLTPLDLGRYGCGGSSLNFTATNACFSITGGATDLRQFSAVSDTGDWDSAVVSPNNAYAYYGQNVFLQSSDILTMNALGWDPIVAVPEPDIDAMLGVGLGLVGWVGRRKKLQAA